MNERIRIKVALIVAPALSDTIKCLKKFCPVAGAKRAGGVRSSLTAF